MKRLLYSDLLKWKQGARRKPLILNGARQVGKTWLLKSFGKQEYAKVAYINFELADNLEYVFSDFNVARIVRALSAMSGVDITPHDTFIILDEAQEYPRALTALKYFCEDAPDYHIAVAGSLLGLTLHSGVSFPVGKVDMLQLYPMVFSEFVEAVHSRQMAETLRETRWDVINALHTQYVELLRQYYYVGGMPGVVSAYCNGEGPMAVRQLQQQILKGYTDDFSKHAESREVPRIKLIWDGIPRSLAKENKKFRYADIKSGGRASQFEIALQWLIDTGVVYKVNRITTPNMPLRFYEENNVFKLFTLDVGLMGAMMQVAAENVLIGDKIFMEYKGAFTELFVCTQLVTRQIPIFYYGNNSSRVEVDFVVQNGNWIVPIEVKSEENVHSKSLRTFIGSHPDLKGIRFSMKPYADQGWMKNIPLYACGEIIK